MMQKVRIFIITAAILIGAVIGVAQTLQPAPAPMQAATPALVPDAKQQAEMAEMAENIKELQELKVQNDEILKQQQAALEALDDLQKEADQMRIYSKRG
jgi:mevalonate kinase